MNEKNEFQFSEPQGRLVFTVTCYLNTDLSNEELKSLFDNLILDISDKNNLIADSEINPITE